MWDISQILVLGAATAAASVTVSKSKVFQSVRDWIDTKSQTAGDLIACHWCMGHWFAAVMIVLSLVSGAPFWGYISLVVEWLAVTAVSGIASFLIMIPMQGQKR